MARGGTLPRASTPCRGTKLALRSASSADAEVECSVSGATAACAGCCDGVAGCRHTPARPRHRDTTERLSGAPRVRAMSGLVGNDRRAGRLVYKFMPRSRRHAPATDGGNGPRVCRGDGGSGLAATTPPARRGEVAGARPRTHRCTRSRRPAQAMYPAQLTSTPSLRMTRAIAQITSSPPASRPGRPPCRTACTPLAHIAAAMVAANTAS